VYDRKVKDQSLTLTVSGKLWNRSLVMQDTQTGSLWSHILGRAMAGELKGAVLEGLPSEMVTWAKWREAHPDTTVLDLQRTSREFTQEFYQQPERFVVGFHDDAGFHHCSFATLEATPALNIKGGNLPLLISFDTESKSALLYDRRIDERVLTFMQAADGKLRDEQTKSLWTRATGIATAGELEGKQLQPYLGVPSYKRAWKTFHPRSIEVGR
jgi:hypothetical protein